MMDKKLMWRMLETEDDHRPSADLRLIVTTTRVLISFRFASAHGCRILKRFVFMMLTMRKKQNMCFAL